MKIQITKFASGRCSTPSLPGQMFESKEALIKMAQGINDMHPGAANLWEINNVPGGPSDTVINQIKGLLKDPKFVVQLEDLLKQAFEQGKIDLNTYTTERLKLAPKFVDHGRGEPIDTPIHEQSTHHDQVGLSSDQEIARD